MALCPHLWENTQINACVCLLSYSLLVGLVLKWQVHAEKPPLHTNCAPLQSEAFWSLSAWVHPSLTHSLTHCLTHILGVLNIVYVGCLPHGVSQGYRHCIYIVQISIIHRLQIFPILGTVFRPLSHPTGSRSFTRALSPPLPSLVALTHDVMGWEKTALRVLALCCGLVDW